MATLKIRAANAASTSSLAPHLPRTHAQAGDLGRMYAISLVSASDLSMAMQDRIYTLFDSNMSPLSATTSMSYTERSKKEELFDSTGRYILLRRLPEGDTSSGIGLKTEGGVDMPGGMPYRLDKGKAKAQIVDFEPDELVGYVSFRFDTEETLSPKDAEVIYCYELQLDPTVRRMGMGKVLMNEMEGIGRKKNLDKAMLTCLKGNKAALAFYLKQGYEADEIDPTRMASEPDSDSEDGEWQQVGADGDDGDDDQEEEEADYVILSKPLR